MWRRERTRGDLDARSRGALLGLSERACEARDRARVLAERGVHRKHRLEITEVKGADLGASRRAALPAARLDVATRVVGADRARVLVERVVIRDRASSRAAACIHPRNRAYGSDSPADVAQKRRGLGAVPAPSVMPAAAGDRPAARSTGLPVAGARPAGS